MKLSRLLVMSHTLTEASLVKQCRKGPKTAPKKISLSFRLESERNPGRTEYEDAVPEGSELGKEKD